MVGAAEVDETAFLDERGVEPEEHVGYVPIWGIVVPGYSAGVDEGCDVGEVVVVIDDVGEVGVDFVGFVDFGLETGGGLHIFGEINHVNGTFPVRQLLFHPVGVGR